MKFLAPKPLNRPPKKRSLKSLFAKPGTKDQPNKEWQKIKSKLKTSKVPKELLALAVVVAVCLGAWAGPKLWQANIAKGIFGDNLARLTAFANQNPSNADADANAETAAAIADAAAGSALTNSLSQETNSVLNPKADAKAALDQFDQGQASAETMLNASEDDGATFDNSYFIDFQMLRDASLSQEVEALTAMATNLSTTEDSRDQAQKAIIAINERQEQEMRIEAILLAKGWQTAVFLETDVATVVLENRELKENAALQIADIVSRHSDISFENINIILQEK